MAHIYTREQLHEQIDNAGKKIDLGARYRHSKTGGEYVVSGFVIIEANEELAVVYRPIDDEEISFIRPVDNFIEIVEINGEKTPRFVRIY